jgi:hypothetical protein
MSFTVNRLAVVVILPDAISGRDVTFDHALLTHILCLYINNTS